MEYKRAQFEGILDRINEPRDDVVGVTANWLVEGWETQRMKMVVRGELNLRFLKTFRAIL